MRCPIPHKDLPTMATNGPPLSNRPTRCTKVVDILEYVTLGDITTSTQIYYDPDPRSTVVDEDVELLEGHFDIQEEEEDDKDTDRYCCKA